MGIGISGLVTQNQYYSNLQVTIDVGIESTEKSISHLEESLSSLVEVILQNRRGLDLLRTAGWTLCSARGRMLFLHRSLGIIKDNMAQVREELAKWRPARVGLNLVSQLPLVDHSHLYSFGTPVNSAFVTDIWALPS